MATKQNLAVSLYWHCKTPRGWRRFRVEPAKGRIRHGWVKDKDRACYYPEGVYHLRTYKDGKSVYEPLTADAAEAMAKQKSAANLLRADLAVRGTGAQIVRPEEPPKTLEEMREAFLEHVGLRIKERSLFSYQRILELFFGTMRKTMPAEIVADDFFRCVKHMEKVGHSEGTIFSYSYRLRRFLKFAGVPKEQLPQKGEMPNEPKLKPQTYSEADLHKLVAGAKTLRNSLFYEFLWKTGAREQEATHLQWPDIDFAAGVVHFSNKPEIGFRIKTSEERDVPLTRDLLESLRDYHAKFPDLRFIFGTGKTSRPRKNSLRYLKRDAWRLGLSCKRCEGCLKYHECERWKLHKFRSTYATNCLQNGVDLRTLMSLLGHQDIQSTMRYLNVADEETTKANLTRIFDKKRPADVITMPKRKQA